ncbi:MAG: hypothetical protein PHO89_05950, partial [Methylacidiphilaceae bacterium]|nr:hypothetical protein [Candidatus Methylacidiphilaceae bacterium]
MALASKEQEITPCSAGSNPRFGRAAVFTLATPDRIAHARVLLTSLARHDPFWERHVFVVDRDGGPSAFSDGVAIQRSIEELSLPDLPSRFVWYDLFEATNSIKPFGFRRLFADGFDTVLYLDADIKVYSEFPEVQEALSRYALVLTPHLTHPLPQDGLLPNEGIIRQAGAFNGGFLAMRNTPETHSFLDWWERTLVLDCLPSSCHDQAWLNYAPCFVSESMVLRHPGYNLAYWNLPYRGLSWLGAEAPRCAGGLPVRFFHFSGFDWRKPEILSKYDTRFRTQGIPSAVSALLEDYVSSLRSEGVERWSQASARLGLSGGYAIPEFLRDWLRQQPVFQAIIQAGSQEDDLEKALLDFLLLPDKTYPWLPIFLGRTFDALPGLLRETFHCKSGFFVQDLATWFAGVGRAALGFGTSFPSRGWWTEERGWETHLPQLEEEWKTRFPSGRALPQLWALYQDYLSSLRPKAAERQDLPNSRLGLSNDCAIPDFLVDWLQEQPAFRAAVQTGSHGRQLEEALLDFLLLPDKTYPWLPIFLGRTFDALPGLRETFRCESGFFVQDLATWFAGVGRAALGFGTSFPSRGWWTEERGWETH